MNEVVDHDSLKYRTLSLTSKSSLKSAHRFPKEIFKTGLLLLTALIFCLLF